MLSVPLATAAWRVLRLQTGARPSDMKRSCQYVEQTAADSRQGAVLQLGE